MPLRTYLPDGDIDVCLLGPHELLAKDHWTTRLRAHIERAEAASAAAARELDTKPNEFAVSEIHVIHAEVKLMKCICDGVVVDVSANQFGGLATLGFLEEVDAFIGRGSIFKRSIVLIKAWGFYESRVLGAHHALISTYALETLVLYVLNAFHEELTTPLEVLHKFLTFFAEFDWDTHAVSIHGPVPLDALDAVRSLPTDLPAGLLLRPRVFVAHAGQVRERIHYAPRRSAERAQRQLDARQAPQRRRPADVVQQPRTIRVPGEREAHTKGAAARGGTSERASRRPRATRGGGPPALRSSKRFSETPCDTDVSRLCRTRPPPPAGASTRTRCPSRPTWGEDRVATVPCRCWRLRRRRARGVASRVEEEVGVYVGGARGPGRRGEGDVRRRHRAQTARRFAGAGWRC